MTSIIYKCSSCDYESNKKNNVHRHYCNHHINIDSKISKITINNDSSNNDSSNNDTNDTNNNKIKDISTHYIYLLKEREFEKTNENIFKLGKTKQLNLKRITNYPNGTILLYQENCIDCDDMEKRIINIFKSKFKNRSDIGYEYFEGDPVEMKKIINEEILHEYNRNKIIDEPKCKKCGKSFSSNSYLKKHLDICKGVSNPLECHICHKVFAHYNSKSFHLKSCKNKK